jgi:hypothetical protein
MNSKSKDISSEELIDNKDLAVLWAVGILVSLLLSLGAFVWNPDQYEALQSTSLDETEARVENSQNQLVVDALNSTQLEYHVSMETAVKLKPAYIRLPSDVLRLMLFPTAPIAIIGLLIRKSMRFSKQNHS